MVQSSLRVDTTVTDLAWDRAAYGIRLCTDTDNLTGPALQQQATAGLTEEEGRRF